MVKTGYSQPPGTGKRLEQKKTAAKQAFCGGICGDGPGYVFSVSMPRYSDRLLSSAWAFSYSA